MASRLDTLLEPSGGTLEKVLRNKRKFPLRSGWGKSNAEPVHQQEGNKAGGGGGKQNDSQSPN